MYGMYKRDSQPSMSVPAPVSPAGGSTSTFDEGAALGILTHLDQAELQSLLDNEDKLSDLISDLKTVKNVQVDREMLLARNKSLAEYNLSRKPRLEQAKGTLAAKYEEAVGLRKVFDQDKQKLEFLAAQMSLDTTLALLQTEAAKSEEETENTVEELLSGSLDVQDFMDKYIESRTLAHERKIKAEKLAEILRTKNATPQTNANFGYGQSSVSSSHSTPYPTGQMAMPDPGRYLQR